MRDTTFATPRNGKNIRFFCKWSNMWSDQRFNEFSAIGSAEKVSVFKGFRHFPKNLRRERWWWPETGAIPPSLRLDNRENSHPGACSQERIRWLLREPSSLTKKHTVPPQMRWSSLGVNCFYWILLRSVMWSNSIFDRSCLGWLRGRDGETECFCASLAAKIAVDHNCA